jgi:hypothetical protein
MLGPCHYCRREIHAAWGYQPDRYNLGIWGCSPQCLDASIEGKGDAMRKELTDNERAALLHAGSVAGAYLDQLGKTDLAALEEAEWETFLEAILVTYTEQLQEECGKPPF